MPDIATEIFRKYGIAAIVIAVLCACLIWGLAHWAASPGTEVSVLWGLVKYTKSPDLDSKSGNEHTSSEQFKPEPSNRFDSVKIIHPIVTKTIAKDSVKPAPPPVPVDIEILSGITARIAPKTLSSLRGRYNLRELTTLESGKPVSDLANGTYFFLYTGYLANSFRQIMEQAVLSSPADRFAATLSSFEIHRRTEGGLFIIGFVAETDAATISRLSGIDIRRIVLSPIPWGSLTSLVAIPLNRVQTSRERKIQKSSEESYTILDFQLK